GSDDISAEAERAAAAAVFQAGQEAWRREREQELLRPDGWTSLVGLHWLELKAHYIGSGERIASNMRLAFGPERMGLVTRDDDDISAEAERAAAAAVFQAGQEAWRREREQELLRPDGWTSLVGLHWLELKAHYIGSGERIASNMRLAFGPERMGLVTRDDD